MYSSSTVKRLDAKSEVSKVKFYNEKAAFIVKNKGTLAFNGKDPLGN
jgi:hypothetical protein